MSTHRDHSEHDHGGHSEPSRHQSHEHPNVPSTREAPPEPGYPEHPEVSDSSNVTQVRAVRRPPPSPHAHGPHHDHSGHRSDAHGGHEGHDKHAGHSVAMFRDKFWISLLLTLPTLVWGHMLQNAFGYHAPTFAGSRWIPPVFGTAVFAYGGWPFVQGAWRELKDRLPGMMTLIALAISVAFVFSAAVTLGYPGMPLWEELATLVTIMLLGHWIEMRSISQAEGALQELAKLLPSTAERIVGARTEEVPVDQLREGDVVLVRPGASIPADGVARRHRQSHRVAARRSYGHR